MANPDERRFAFVPLTYQNKDRAIEGEILVDRTTGDIWVCQDNLGNFVSATADLEQQILDIINGGSTSYSFAYMNNRKVYKFYYDDSVVRLDQEMIEELPSGVAYYRIRDLYDNTKYYVPNLTNIHYDAASIYPFTNNEVYLVEFYNTSFEMLTQINFTAKYAPAVLQSGDPNKILNHIELYTNRDYLYQHEDVSALLIRVFAVYEDSTSRDITNDAQTTINNPVDTNVIGDYTVSATYYYDTVHGLYMTDDKVVSVVADTYANIIDMIVVPRKIIDLNNGQRSILLDIIAYYEDGLVKNVSEECIVTGFDPQLFNVVQHITVSLDIGHTSTYTQNYDIKVDDDGSASENVLFFRDNIMKVDPAYSVPAGAVYYRVRAADDLNFWYTPNMADVGYETLFFDKPLPEEQLQTGMNVIIEFYNSTQHIVDAVVFTVEYNPSI